jgi:hypothetical protein
VQALAVLADQLGEPALDRHVHVLVARPHARSGPRRTRAPRGAGRARMRRTVRAAQDAGLPSMRACTAEPTMSSGHSRRSTSNDCG